MINQSSIFSLLFIFIFISSDNNTKTTNNDNGNNCNISNHNSQQKFPDLIDECDSISQNNNNSKLSTFKDVSEINREIQ